MCIRDRPTSSELGKRIKSAKIGVVWHTTYTGKTLQDMKASFGANIKGLKKELVLKKIKPILEDQSIKKVGQNIKRKLGVDYRVLYRPIDG